MNHPSSALYQPLSISDALSRLLRMLCRGLPAYVSEVNPWMQPKHEPIRAALENLAGDFQLFAQRTAKMIQNRGGHPDPGPFPLEYTGLNDVSIVYLAHELINSLRLDIEILGVFSARLADPPDLHALIEEIIGNTKGHVEILEKMVSGE